MQGDTILAVVYLPNASGIAEHVQLHSTYCAENAVIRPVMMQDCFQIGSSPYEITLTKHTFIQQAVTVHDLAIHNYYQLTRFGDLESLIDHANPKNKYG